MDDKSYTNYVLSDLKGDIKSDHDLIKELEKQVNVLAEKNDKLDAFLKLETEKNEFIKKIVFWILGLAGALFSSLLDHDFFKFFDK